MIMLTKLIFKFDEIDDLVKIDNSNEFLKIESLIKFVIN